MEIGFEGQVAVITGAGGGLGRGYALELARRGARVVVNDVGATLAGEAVEDGEPVNAADVVVAEIEAAGGEAVANTESVATVEGGESIVQSALDTFGRVDIVISNAGIIRDAAFAKLEPGNLDAVFDVHLRGAFFVSQPAFRVMKEQGYGRFLFAGSGAGIFGNFGQSNYAAAKMGLVGLSNVLAIEGQRTGITSNVIAPGALTRMTEAVAGPLAGVLDASHVTPMAIYLVSRECEFTHEVFSAQGGHFARIFVGRTDGWFAGTEGVATVEDIAANIEEIRSEHGYVVPSDFGQELAALAKLHDGHS